MEETRYQGTPPMITALANDELDIAVLAFSTLGLAIQNAGIDDLRVVADGFRDGAPGYHKSVLRAQGFRHRQDRGPEGQGACHQCDRQRHRCRNEGGLKKHGLIDKRDYTVIEAPFPTMASMLKEKKADLVSAAPPFSFNPIFKTDGKVLMDQTAGIGRSQFTFWTVRKSLIDKNRAALVDFIEDMIRIERWYLDPKNHDEVTKIAANLLKVPPERVNWIFTKQDYYRDPDMMPDLVALQRNVDTTLELGFIKSRLDVKQHSDLSLIEEAAKRLK